MQPPYVGPRAEPAHLSPGPSQPQPVSSLGALKFVFEDAEWKYNVLIGMVLMLIPIVGPLALSGWLMEVHQRLVRRHPRPVPKLEFSDFVFLLQRGVTPFLVSLVTTVPLIFVMYAMMFGVGFGAFAVQAATNEALFAVGVGLIGFVLLVVFWCVFAILMNAAMTRAELLEDFGRTLSFGELMAYARSTAGKVMVKTFTFGFLSFGIVLLGMLACYIGMYPAIVVLQIASMHLRWQIYENYVANGGTPLELKPPQWLPSEAERAQAQYQLPRS
jgi:hypothetical protein